MISHWLPEQWFAFMIDCTLKASLIIAVAFALTAALRRRSAATRHLVWAAALFSSALLPFCSLLIPSWHSRLGIPMSERLTPQYPVEKPAVVAAAATMVEATTQTATLWTSEKLIVLIWLLGSGLGAAILIAGIVRLIWISCDANAVRDVNWVSLAPELSKVLELKRAVRLRQSGKASILATWGTLRPQILLPPGAENWSFSRVRSVLGHEMAHVQRHDWVIQILAEAVRAFYWFNPLLWLACNHLRQESERACDDTVLGLGIDGTEYATDLLELARALKHSNRAWSPALAMARPSTLERRFAAMLNPSLDRRATPRKTALAVFVLSFCLVLPLAAMRAPIQGVAGSLSGRIYDNQGTPVQNAIVVAVDRATGKADMTASNAMGIFRFLQLTPSQYDVRTSATGFQPFEVQSVKVDANQDTNLNILTLAVAGGSQVGSTLVEVQPVPSQQPAAAFGKKEVRVGGTTLQTGLIVKVNPPYPASARDAGIQGNVILSVVIGKDGVPDSMVVKSPNSNPDLVQAAVDAVKQWRYQPVLLNGAPVEAETIVNVNFSLGNLASSVPAPPASPASAAPAYAAPATERVPPPPPPPPPVVRQRIGGAVAKANLIYEVTPVYPPEATAARIQGMVILEIRIGTDGIVQNASPISGHELLIQAAMDAVAQFRYKPTFLNGQPVEVTTTVVVNFTLDQGN